MPSKKIDYLPWARMSYSAGMITLAPLLADVGVPMIFVQMPFMVMALIPIILVESFICMRRLKLSWKRSVPAVGIANLVTTLVGIPLVWIAMFGLNRLTTGGRAMGLESPLQKIAAVTLQASWLIPYEEDLYWMVPTAFIILLIPAFFLSVLIERIICARFWKDVESKHLSKAIWLANIVSYLLLVASSFLLVER